MCFLPAPRRVAGGEAVRFSLRFAEDRRLRLSVLAEGGAAAAAAARP